MGLLKAAIDSVSGVLADQWKEYFYCDALDSNTIVVRGKKKTSGRANRKGNDNVITDGSVICVADGQCMILVDQGKVTEICAEPGYFTYESATAPSIFAGDLKGAIRETFDQIGARFSFGGQAAQDQRIYYFNTKEIMGNKYGTPSPVPFRVVDQRAGIDIDISVRCFGEYSYKVTNPILFYTNVCGNISGDFMKDQLEGQLRTELLTALQPAFARISDQGIRYSSLPGHTQEMADALNEQLSARWKDLRGIEIAAFGVSSIKATEEDEKMLKEMQRNAALRDPLNAAAHIVGAQADAMKTAAGNAGGAAIGFMGMNMAANAGGFNANNLYQAGMQQQTPAQPAPQSSLKENENSWKCPQCGTLNQGKFCTECGAKKPAGVPQYRCDKCGWVPEDPAHPPKFCPNCGDPFDDGDIVS